MQASVVGTNATWVCPTDQSAVARIGEAQEDPSGHRLIRTFRCQDTLVKAFDMLTDAGISYEGLSLRTALEKAGLNPAKVEEHFAEKWDKTPISGARFMDLPVQEASKPEVEEPVDDADEDDDVEPLDDILNDFDEHGTRIDDDGTVVISGVVTGTMVEDAVDEGNLPVVIETAEGYK